MLKNLLIASTVAVAAVCAKADTLFWQIAGDDEFTKANLFVTGEGLDNNVKLTTVAAQGVDGTSQLTGTTTGMVMTDLSTYTGEGYSFFVEMITYSQIPDPNPTKTYGRTWSYNELMSAGYISTGSIGVPIPGEIAGGVNLGPSGAIPEPTSGLLMLMGGALLALRRRRRA